MKKIVFYILLSLLAFSCESDSPAGKSRLTIRNEANTWVISGSQIRSYNLATRELVWRSYDAFRLEEFKSGGSLVFELDGEELFRVREVSPFMSYIVRYPMEFCWDRGSKSSFLYGNTDWLDETQAVKNSFKWARFIECLEAEGRLK